MSDKEKKPMDKAHFTTLFTIVSSLINIVCTLLMIGVLIALASVILKYVIHCQTADVYMIVFMLCFIGGMILNMFIFAKVSGYVVKKHHWEDRLDSRMLGIRGAKNNGVYTYEEKEPEKTVMPDSVLDKEEDSKWAEE